MRLVDHPAHSCVVMLIRATEPTRTCMRLLPLGAHASAVLIVAFERCKSPDIEWKASTLFAHCDTAIKVLLPQTSCRLALSQGMLLDFDQ